MLNGVFLRLTIYILKSPSLLPVRSNLLLPPVLAAFDLELVPVPSVVALCRIVDEAHCFLHRDVDSRKSLSTLDAPGHHSTLIEESVDEGKLHITYKLDTFR